MVYTSHKKNFQENNNKVNGCKTHWYKTLEQSVYFRLATVSAPRQAASSLFSHLTFCEMSIRSDIRFGQMSVDLQSINQSINQTSIVPISPAKPGSVARQRNQCSTAESRKQFRNIKRPWGVWRYLWGKGQIKEMCLQIFLEGRNWTCWTDRQRQVVPKRRGTRVKSSSTSIGLDPRDWQTNIIVWSQWTGRNRCGKHGVKINRLFSRNVL